LTFTTDAISDFSKIVTAHPVSLTLRTRTASTYNGDDILTYSSSDSTITAVFIDRISQRELYNLAGVETEAESIAMIKTTDTVDLNDQILHGTTVYDIIEIINKPDSTNTIVQLLLLKQVRP